MLTATNPENGTVTYTYSGTTGLVTQKQDAKGNKVTYVYDSLKRPTEIHGWIGAVDQADQLVKLYYDSNPSYGWNLSGRLAYTEWWSKRKAPGWVGAGSTPLAHFKEMYSYSPAGVLWSKRLWVESGVASDILESSYTSDNEGRMTGQNYPAAQPSGGGADVPGESFVYGLDAMGRPNTMTSNGGATNWISGVTYDAAGLPTAITAGNGSVAGETREYNVLGQLTKIVSGNYDFRYNFSASANDGRITSQSAYQGGVLQETINYSYDSLNRLTGASTSAGTAWSATYSYDGFTNLLGVTPSGAGPSAMSITVNASNNRVNGWTYDANGNTTAKPGLTADYDVENRLQWASGPDGEEYYGYGPDNRRVYQSKLLNPGTGATQEIVTFWSAGKRAARYELNWSESSFVFRTLETNVWFGGKPLKLGSETNVVVDRLGSVRRSAKDYFPYGQENPSTTAGEKEKYATYYHDGRTDLAYADQRYYATGAGRFMTADPAGDGLNWYSYVGGDPVNNRDPSGLAGCTYHGPYADNPDGPCPPGYLWEMEATSTRVQVPAMDAWADYFTSWTPDETPVEYNQCQSVFNGNANADIPGAPGGLYPGNPMAVWNEMRSGTSSTVAPDRRWQLIEADLGVTRKIGVVTDQWDVEIGSVRYNAGVLIVDTNPSSPWVSGFNSGTYDYGVEAVRPAAVSGIYGALFILHELAHIYDTVYHRPEPAYGIPGYWELGGSTLPYDDRGDDIASLKNNDYIFNQCIAPRLNMPRVNPARRDNQ